MHARGLGVAEDHTEASRLYLAAVDAGDPRAMNNLAVNCLLGRGISVAPGHALTFFRAAADKGHATAMTNLARMYQTGRGIAQDEAAAASWALEAVKAGNADLIGEIATRPQLWTRGFAQALQLLLKGEGTYGGRIDGDIGSDTIRSLRAALNA